MKFWEKIQKQLWLTYNEQQLKLVLIVVIIKKVVKAVNSEVNSESDCCIYPESEVDLLDESNLIYLSIL